MDTSTVLRHAARRAASILLLAFLLASAACGVGRPEQPALLPPGLSDALLPPADVDAFVYAAPSAGISVGAETGFAAPVLARRVMVWLAPWQGELISGLTMEMPTERAAELGAALFQRAPGTASVRGRHLIVVKGVSPAAADLAATVGRDGLASLASHNPAALAILDWLPAQAPSPGSAGSARTPLAETYPAVVAYGRLTDEVLARLGARTGSADLVGVAEGVRSARISRAAVAIYGAPSDLASIGNLDLMGPEAAGIVVAPARLPGWAVGSILRSSAGNLGLGSTTLPQGEAFGRQLGSQRVLVTNLGNKVYVSFSRDADLALALLDSARAQR